MIFPVDLVLLDLGNTLYYDKDPWPPIFLKAESALWESLRGAGIKAQPGEIYGEHETLLDLYNADHRKDLSEPTTATVLKEILGQKGIVASDNVVAAALRAMYAVTQTNWHVEPEAVPLLQELELREFRLGVISNAADEENTRTLIDKGGIRPYLEFIISSAAFGKRKPDPGIFRLALDHFGIPAERTVMVGDSYEADIVGAKQLGMHTIWIPRDAEEAVKLPHVEADVVVGRLLDIPAVISH
jgi:HAD superfamily hydrolase (TIGR01549 family)